MKFRCVICDADDKWENVDQHKNKPVGMAICNGCGFVTYPEKLSDKEDKLKDFYRHDYRKPPNVHNMFTGERKLHYHAHFLQHLFKKWRDDKMESPVVCEIGAAFGMFLDKIIRGAFPSADLNGTELTKSFRANAWEEYRIQLTEEIDTSKTYDLIASYKVAEHQQDVDKELRKYVELLSPGGWVYISVPCWFDVMNNFGTPGFDLEYYYHTNHINMWTRKLFEVLLKKVGLRIEQENHVYYDSTYLCVRDDSVMTNPFVFEYEDPVKIKEIMAKIKQAAQLADKKLYKEALDVYPKFPLAWHGYYETNRALFDREGGWGFIEPNVIKGMLGALPNSSEVFFIAADLAMRYNKWDAALGYLDTGLKMKPNSEQALKCMGHCFRQLSQKALVEGNVKEGVKFLIQARDSTRHLLGVSSQSRDEAISWIYNDNARIWDLLDKSGLWKGDKYYGVFRQDIGSADEHISNRSGRGSHGDGIAIAASAI